MNRLLLLPFLLAAGAQRRLEMVWLQTLLRASAVTMLTTSPLQAEPLICDMSEYKPAPGLVAAVDQETLSVNWAGQRGVQLRLLLAIDAGQPVVRELAVRQAGGQWSTLGRNLKPEFNVTTGLRRISEQQLNPLRQLGRELSPELLEKEKWNVFWDAPLNIPGTPGVNPDLPRRAEEVRRATATYKATSCAVKTNGARLEISFPGLSLGIFSGSLQFTVYRGTNLLRQEAIARTEEPSVAYKYSGGLKGFKTESARRVIWRDTGGDWQKYEFGGSSNSEPVALRARNRLAIVETGEGSVAVFPPPHKFFWAREVEINLGYVWYRKDDPTSFSIGVRHGNREEMFKPYGVSDEIWEKQVQQARAFAQGNFALYNAPPGTGQRMAVYFYVSPEAGPATQRAVMALTHNDRYKPLPGHQVMVCHYHTHFAEQLTDLGNLDTQPPWISAFRALGINIAIMSDFHADSHPLDAGPLRLQELNTYFEACRRHSDRDFLILPGEEPNVHLGGHYTLVFPRPVYWSRVRHEGQRFVEQHPKYGTVYHPGSALDMLEMLRREKALVWLAHPRTKGSTGYPDAIRETDAFRSEHYLGAAFQSFPVDQSEKRLCESRCFSTLDDMNNWSAPKYLVAEGDSYTKYPQDEIYGQSAVNYVKVARLPEFDEDWSPITQALRAGEFFVTTGEVLFRHFSVEGASPQRTVVAEVEWTFPLEFLELVWGDGQTTGRQVISATDRGPFARERFRIPFDATGKKWVRFAVWDSAGNGAFTQPVHLNRRPR